MALQKLDQESRRLELAAKGPSADTLIAQEREQSYRYGGRSAFGWERPVAPAGARGATAARPK